MRQVFGIFSFSLLFSLLVFYVNPSFSQRVDSVYVNNVMEWAKKEAKEGNAQQVSDSLEHLLIELETANLPKKELQVLSFLTDFYARNRQFPELVNTLKQKIKILEPTKDLRQLGQTYELMCYYLYLGEKFEEGIKAGNEAIRISKITQDSITRLYAFNEISHCYFSIGQWDYCADYSFRCLKLAEQVRDTVYIAKSYMILGRVYKAQEEFASSETYLKKSIAIFEARKDSNRMLPPLNDLGILYREMQAFNKASQVYKRILEITIKKNKNEDQLSVSINLAILSVEQKDFEEANKYMPSIDSLVLLSTRNEGKVEVNKLKAQLALHKKDYSIALSHINTALKIAEGNDIIPKIPDILEVKGEIYEEMGNYKEALKTFKSHAEKKDELLNTEKNKIIEELQARFETAEKEKQLQEQASEIELTQLRLRIALFIGVLIVLLGIGFAYVWRRRNELKRKVLENEQNLLKEKNKSLEEMNQLKTRFFNNISHELRTPISLISTPLIHLLDSLSSVTKEEIQQTLKITSQNANKLLLIVEEILELSRVEAGKIELDEKPLAVSKFCKQIFSLHHSKAEYKEIEYEFVSNIDEKVSILTDRKKLEKIINNLISNALRYTEHKGRVSFHLHTSLIEDTSSTDKKMLTIRVEDTGRGIPKQDVPYVFDRYFQSKSKDLPVEGGTGIGLALAKELTNLLGGEIKVESEWGKGSIFTVNIPFQEVELEQEESISDLLVKNAEEETLIIDAESQLLPVANPSTGIKPTLLIVEDNPDIQWMIQNLLKDEYDCLIANNGVEALKLLEMVDEKSILPSLILSDIMMPQMDGYVLLEKLKSQKEWQKIPVVMLTARAEEEGRLKALRMGVDDYLTKPFSPLELKARIQNLLFNYNLRKDFLKEAEKEVDFTFEEVKDADQQWLQELETAAKDGLDKKIAVSAAYLADQMALSERQLRRRIQVLTGLNSKQYIQEAKLQKARHFLENNAFRSIAEVSYECGFNTPSYFAKLYTKHFGKKPSEYLVKN